MFHGKLNFPFAAKFRTDTFISRLPMQNQSNKGECKGIIKKIEFIRKFFYIQFVVFFFHICCNNTDKIDFFTIAEND